MTLSTYQTGTATVSVGGTTVTGSGTIWTGGNAREGDVIVIGDASAMVLAVVSATELTITPWPGSAETDASYTIYQTSPRRFDSVEVADDLRKQVAALNDAGYFVLVEADQSEPDPSLGDEDQWALQKSTGKMWFKAGGVWVPAGNFRGIKPDFTVPEIEDRAAHDDDPTGTIVLVADEGAIYVKLSAANGDWSEAVPLKGDKGDQGDTATIEVGTVTTGLPGTAAGVTNSGDEHAAVLDFTIPRGATVDVGTVTTGAPGSSADVSNSGTGGDVVLDFTIPTGKGYGGTSDTELTIGTGNQTFGIEPGLAFVVGDRVHIGATSAPLNWMEGFITAYASTSMTVAVSDVGGSGTFDDWGIGLTGKPGTGDGDMKAAIYDPSNAAADAFDSANHAYDNSVSGLDSGNVQDAIDEVASRDFVVPHLFGLTLSNNVSDPDNDIDIAPGQASAIDLSATIKLASAITKRLDAAWAVGDGNGGLDTGSAAINTTYHLWLIRRSDTGVVDALFSTSATNPVLPSNYDGKRRIGAVMTDGDGDIIPFRQVGGWFHFVGNVVGMIISDANVSTATNIALPVPQGIKVLADFGLAISSNSTDTGGIFIGARDPDTGAATVYDNVVLGLKGTDGNQVQCWTNTAAQVSFFGSKSGTKILIYPRGFYDGRDTYV